MPRPEVVPFCSTVTGDFAPGMSLDADYWARNLLQPVQFWAAIQRLAASRHGFFVELGGHAVLTPAIRQNYEHLEESVVALPSLHRDEDGQMSLLRALGGLHCAGWHGVAQRGAEPATVDWRPVVGKRRLVTLPRYPWQHQRFWFDGDRDEREVVSSPESAAQIAPGVGEHEPVSTAPAPGSSVADGADQGGESSGPRGQLVRALNATGAHRRRELLLGHVLDEAASVLGLVGDEADLEPVQGFFQLGMDSRMAVELTDRLARALDRPLPSTVTFEHPTSDALCDALINVIDTAPRDGPGPPAAAVPARVVTHPPAARSDAESAPAAAGQSEDDVVALLRNQIAALEAGDST